MASADQPSASAASTVAGATRSRSILSMVRLRAPPPATRSELERRFVEVCGEAGLPRPAVNVVVAGLEVDMVWADRKLVVELDGYAFHRTRAMFERDRIRDASLALAGYRVLRVTYRRLEHQPAAVAETVRSLLR